MDIEKINIEKIKPYERNAKLHPQEQIEQIKKSILEFGNNDPIAIDENNIIIEGHGRYEALKQLNYKEVECIRLSHLTEEQKKAYILVHNKLTMNTGFDFNILDAELSEIINIDMGQFNFEIPDIDIDALGTEFELPDDDKPQTRTITLSLAEEQYQIAMKCIDYITDNNLIVHDYNNANKKSNALFEVVYLWAEQKILL